VLRSARDIGRLPGLSAVLAGCALVSAVAGCAAGAISGERAPNIEVRDALERITPSSPTQSYPFEMRVAPFADHRPMTPTRKIGDVRATVFDLHANELVVDQGIGVLVTAALDAELVASGLRPSGNAARTASVTHDVFELSGSIDELTLNIAGRDEVSIAIEARVRDARDGRVIWTGVVAEKRDRYAGVSGNTKRSIARFLGEAVQTVARNTVSRASNSILQARPELLQVSTQRQAAPPDDVAALPATAPPAVEGAQYSIRAASGRLRITTAPARAKVYIGDVYFGLSPLDLQLDPAIHLLRLELDGFKPATQRVSVRDGETTELEVTLEK
jgi:hypothetical protein